MGRIFSGKLGAYLQLIRLPNIFTAIADVLAGYLIVFGGNIDWSSLLSLIAASACIYGGGCVFNDYCDLRLDLQERSYRPIPSGKISIREAIFLASLLFLMGIGFASTVNSRTAMLSVLLVILVIAYDRFSKDTLFWGSFTMALCRGGNLLLGMWAGSLSEYFFLFVVLSTWYVFWLTSLSKFETTGNIGKYRWVIAAGIASVVLALVVLITVGSLYIVSIIYLCFFICLIAGPLWKWLKVTSPGNTGNAVKFLVLGIPLLDSIYLAGVQGPVMAVPVLACAVVAIAFAKYLYVT
jgi:4-hydroxybenzoate polyprenyltransferase